MTTEMRPKQPPPIKVPKDKPYSFSGWKWKGGKWNPVFTQKPAAKKANKQAWKAQMERIEELDASLDHAIEKG